MFIIPLEKSIDWKKPPLITILLILVNSFVFFFIQTDDDALFEEAVNYYLNSALPEIEFPFYTETLEARGEITEPINWQEELQNESLLPIMLLMQMESDEAFMTKLRAHQVITVEHSHFAQWQTQRNEYETLKQQSVAWGYGFKPAEHRFVTFLTHIFLHGSVAHLIGNMIFLFIVGFTLEVALGSFLYLLFYLIGGLSAVTLFWGIYPSSIVPLVGASGAIAALMGLYSTIFGLRKIRFFYFLLFYFDYVKAPAFILLFLWLFNEFYQLHWGGQSNVAYVAHIGGLIAGAALGLLVIKRFPEKVNTEYLDESTKKDKRIQRLEQGMQLLRELKVERAKAMFLALHKYYPEDKEIRLQLYKVLKFSPQSEDYHRITLRLLSQSGKDAQTQRQVHEIFSDYMKTTGGKIRISPGELVQLATRFAKADYPENAERILLMLLRKRPNLPGLADGLLALAYAWRRAKNDNKSKKYLKFVQQRFPQSDAAK